MFRMGKAVFESIPIPMPQMLNLASLSKNVPAPTTMITTDSKLETSRAAWSWYRSTVSVNVKRGSQALTTCTELEEISA